MPLDIILKIDVATASKSIERVKKRQVLDKLLLKEWLPTFDLVLLLMVT